MNIRIVCLAYTLATITPYFNCKRLSWLICGIVHKFHMTLYVLCMCTILAAFEKGKAWAVQPNCKKPQTFCSITSRNTTPSLSCMLGDQCAACNSKLHDGIHIHEARPCIHAANTLHIIYIYIYLYINKIMWFNIMKTCTYFLHYFEL